MVVTLVFVTMLLLAMALDRWVIRPWEKKHRPRRPTPSRDGADLVVPRTLFFHPGQTTSTLSRGLADGEPTDAGVPARHNPLHRQQQPGRPLLNPRICLEC